VIGLTHHELIVVLQQQRPFRRIQSGRDLLRLDGEVLGDLRSDGEAGARSVDARIPGRSNKKGRRLRASSTRPVLARRLSVESHGARLSRSGFVPGRRPRLSSCPCPWRAVSQGRSRAGESGDRGAAAPCSHQSHALQKSVPGTEKPDSGIGNPKKPVADVGHETRACDGAHYPQKASRGETR
jgi:hypothetical protein